MKSINFPWNPPLLARHPFPLLLLTSLLATRVKTEKFTISKKQGSYFGNRILFILVHIYLDFLKTSYASNYFWDSEYFWDIFIRYFLNFFYGPPLLSQEAKRKKVRLQQKRSQRTKRNRNREFPSRKHQKKNIEKPKRKKIGRKKESILLDTSRESRGK